MELLRLEHRQKRRRRRGFSCDRCRRRHPYYGDEGTNLLLQQQVIVMIFYVACCFLSVLPVTQSFTMIPPSPFMTKPTSIRQSGTRTSSLSLLLLLTTTTTKLLPRTTIHTGTLKDDEHTFIATTTEKKDGDDDESTTAINESSMDATTTTTATTPPSPPPPPTSPPVTVSSTALRKKKGRNVRLQVFSTLNLPIVEVASALAVFLSSLLVAVDTLQDLPFIPGGHVLIDDMLLFLNILFASEFILRWYAAGQFKVIYLTKPLVVLDIVVVIVPLLTSGAVVPLLQFFLHDIAPAIFGSTTATAGSGMEATTAATTNELIATDSASTLVNFLIGLQNSAGLQNLLLLRVLRLRRVLTDINTFGKFQVALGLNKPQDIRPYQLQLARVLLTIVTLLSVASGLIYTAEHEVNPNIPDYFSALYFGLTTLTTVGFGDISPITAQGRLVVCGSILVGIAVIPAQAAKLVDVLVESGKQLEQTTKQTNANKNMSNKAKRKQQSVKGSAVADGKGPSGVSIDSSTTETISRDDMNDDVSAITAAAAVASAASDGIMELEDNKRTCIQCGTASHRIDANFCWSCGSEL